jgi:TM2 domain-containing membrane protein YozV
MLSRLRILAVLLVTVLRPLVVSAQEQLDDVVYLKNGRVIRGVIVEQTLEGNLTIRTHDGNLFVLQMAEVQMLAKEARLGKKYPALALGLSLVGGVMLDGAGQFYNGDTGKGVLFLGWSALSLFLMAAGSTGAIIAAIEEEDEEDVGKLVALAYVGALSRLTSYVGAAVDAYLSARQKNKQRGYGIQLERDSPRVVLHILPAVRRHPRRVSVMITASF